MSIFNLQAERVDIPLRAVFFFSILHIYISLSVMKGLYVPGGYEAKNQLIYACNKITYYKSLSKA